MFVGVCAQTGVIIVNIRELVMSLKMETPKRDFPWIMTLFCHHPDQTVSPLATTQESIKMPALCSFIFMACYRAKPTATDLSDGPRQERRPRDMPLAGWNDAPSQRAALWTMVVLPLLKNTDSSPMSVSWSPGVLLTASGALSEGNIDAP